MTYKKLQKNSQKKSGFCIDGLIFVSCEHLNSSADYCELDNYFFTKPPNDADPIIWKK
ncbi:hypothetical protein BH10BAC2_BH10BAC2_04440 [soil metagenome]